MSIKDYYRTVNYVEKKRQSDGTGGFEYVYVIGEKFDASVVKASSQEQMVAGVRGITGEQYNLTTNKKNPIEPNDILMFVSDDLQKVFLRVNSNPLYTPKQSNQVDWKGFTATVIEPDLRVVE